MRKVRILIVVCAFIFVAQSAMATNSALNKELVTAFFEMAFTERKPVEAAMKYISEEQYIQHNPNGKDGRDAFVNGFAKHMMATKFVARIKRVIAEGDLVVVHSHGFNDPNDSNDRGEASVDIFRVKNGKIVEHWDVVQPVPEKSNNNNTMF